MDEELRRFGDRGTLLGRKLDAGYVMAWVKRLDESLGGSEVASRWEDAVARAKEIRKRRR